MKGKKLHEPPTGLRVGHHELLDSLNVGFILLDLDFRYLDVNKTYLKMTGLSREDIVGHHSLEFYEREEFNKLRDIVLPFREHDDYQLEFILPTLNGERIPVVHNSHINRDDEGRPVSIYVTTTDIREQKKAQEEMKAANLALRTSQDKLEKENKMKDAILFGIGDCVTIFEQNGALLLSNPKAMEVRGKRRTPYLPLNPNKQQLNLKVKGETRQFFCQVKAIKDQNGAVWAYIETLNDITSQVMLEKREHELYRIKRDLGRNNIAKKMLGISRAMENVFELILRCSEVDSSILILGETGVGKEMAAHAIHSQSARKNKPFVAVNCGALPENLLESELFGHTKGAFTGAISDRLGLFQEATGGTLFLDEVGDLNINLQVKLLRVIQGKEVRPVGSDKAYPIDVRVITATNRDIEERIKLKLFRSDLYYRIAVITIIIPPLSDRKEDIIPLAEHFMKKHRKRGGKSHVTLDHTTQKVLLDYPWPGNIRELENAIEHCLAMTKDTVITPESLPVNIVSKKRSLGIYSEPVTTLSFDKQPSMEEKQLSPETIINLGYSEKETILNALRYHQWNRTRAARELGICRTTLWRKIAKHNLSK
ncbi:MAG: sigma 54-interacting transcriptional regulator [Deltaproteobacteria bacterium]|nr:sigma 54-interacting transcriptional regulator [Deltaproteobacteria bacterium]